MWERDVCTAVMSRFLFIMTSTASVRVRERESVSVTACVKSHNVDYESGEVLVHIAYCIFLDDVKMELCL